MSLCEFTSHYVPIKSEKVFLIKKPKKLFTSHYVPIKSTVMILFFLLSLYLHPIMFLLNPDELATAILEGFNLHPIMFLLNLWWEDAENYKYLNLHPIMFLLNRVITMLQQSKVAIYIPLCSY